VFVHHSQGPEPRMFGVVVVAKRKRVAAVEPVELGFASLSRSSNRHHGKPPLLSTCHLLTYQVIGYKKPLPRPLPEAERGANLTPLTASGRGRGRGARSHARGPFPTGGSTRRARPRSCGRAGRGAAPVAARRFGRATPPPRG